MNTLKLKAGAAAVVLALGAAAANAAVVTTLPPTLSYAVDSGEATFIEAGAAAGDKLVWEVDRFISPDGNISLSARLDPDPIITSAVSVLDFGVASNFNFSFALPIVQTIGPVTLKLTIGGSCTDANSNGCSVTPNLASGFFADGLLDSVVKISGGSAFTNGLNSPTGAFGPTDVLINLPAGPYNNLGLNLGFLGSGGGDAISFTLGVEVVNSTVPEPGSLALVALAAGAAVMASRRKKPA